MTHLTKQALAPGGTRQNFFVTQKKTQKLDVPTSPLSRSSTRSSHLRRELDNFDILKGPQPSLPSLASVHVLELKKSSRREGISPERPSPLAWKGKCASSRLLARVQKEGLLGRVTMLQNNVWRHFGDFLQMSQRLLALAPPQTRAGVRACGPVWMTSIGFCFRERRDGEWQWVPIDAALDDDVSLRRLATVSKVATFLQPNLLQHHLARLCALSDAELCRDVRVNNVSHLCAPKLAPKTFCQRIKGVVAQTLSPYFRDRDLWPEGLYDLAFWVERHQRGAF